VVAKSGVRQQIHPARGAIIARVMAMRDREGTSAADAPPRRRFGVRLLLAIAFAGVGLVTAGSVYLFVSDQTTEAIDEREAEIAVERTRRLAARLELGGHYAARTRTNITDNYSAWVVDRNESLLTPAVTKAGEAIEDVPSRDEAIRIALDGELFTRDLGSGGTVVAAPIDVEGEIEGAVLASATRPEALQQSLDRLQEDRLTTLLIAVGVAVLVAIAVATPVTTRLKRLASDAAQLAAGRLDRPVRTRGRDEIGDLGRALERMRLALRESFDALSSERDRLSAIFESLSDAVMVVSPEGKVRFSNPAAGRLIGRDSSPLEPLRPWFRRAADRGECTHDGLRLEDRVYALNARLVKSENAVLMVVRDRTEELQRELAEREFVSNAAHELRNPIAGISGAIEVLESGAKEDPQARDHFLRRLSEDAERVSRLTHSLLTLARMEAIGEGEAEVVGVKLATEEAAGAITVPDEIDFVVKADHELAAKADPVLLRQVLIGLLTNAFKHTPAPGTVTLRAHRGSDDEVVIEVTDTGLGIPPTEVGRVFERFYRGSAQLESDGFGLGLSIAKRMVEVMGGEIGVRSDPGRGSTFWVRLPVAEPSATPVA
jgi:two-component system, OmpR family, phosphate regulon sensor histidine kinase PhoR